MKRAPLVSLVCFSSLISSCSLPSRLYEVFNDNHRPYKLDGDSRSDGSTIENLGRAGSHPVSMGFLEFDDQGELWRTPADNRGWQPGSHTQLPTVIKELKRQAARGPVKTVIFIHGWNHSAQQGDDNLEAFKNSLKKLGDISDTPIFGVYVGWRGTLGTHPLDVASREATADRVGGASLLTCLRALSAATHDKPGSSVLAIGHSFGAKVLAQVTCNDFAVQIGTKIGQENSNSSEFKPFADTIILANTAESGSVPLQLMNIMRDHKITYETSTGVKRALPLIVSISSPHDSATGSLLPTWNNFARNVLALPHKGGATSNKIQDQSLFNAMGFYGPLRSHSVHLEGGDPPNTQVAWNRENPEQENWAPILKRNIRLGREYARSMNAPLSAAFTQSTDLMGFQTYTIDHLDQTNFSRYSNGAVENHTPFWFIQVPDFVSRDHNDVWNPNFTGLIVALEAMKDPRGNPTRLTPTTKPTLMLSPAN